MAQFNSTHTGAEIDAAITAIKGESVALASNDALIETGSNANGKYTKFPDGTLICTHTVNSSSSGFSAWVYPSAFLVDSVNSLQGTISTTAATSPESVHFDTYWNTTAYFAAATTSGVATRTCFLTAIGRWK